MSSLRGGDGGGGERRGRGGGGGVAREGVGGVGEDREEIEVGHAVVVCGGDNNDDYDSFHSSEDKIGWCQHAAVFFIIYSTRNQDDKNKSGVFRVCLVQQRRA